MSHDADQLQAMASDPLASVWVNASAGTGKTKVLTDRVLRLLLGITAPERILCITFTKAAAAEMARRIQDRLSAWAAIDDDVLIAELTKLTREAPDAATLRRARQLFGTVVDAPGGLKIQTIHAFCTSVLRRFPIEAGISPQFDVVNDADADAMLVAIRDQLIRHPDDPALAAALGHLAGELSDGAFLDLITRLNAERRKLHALLDRQGGLAAAIGRIEQETGFSRHDSPTGLIAAFCQDGDGNVAALRGILPILAQSKNKTMADLHANLAPFLAATPQDRVPLFDGFCRHFLTNDGDIRKNLVTKDCESARPVMQAVAEKMIKIQKNSQAIQVTKNSIAVLTIGAAIIDRYDQQKKQRGLLDYEDQVLKTRDLLKDQLAAQWVMYKLDGGLDHLLVDEAQDTNPAQWQIIQALTEDFFSGEQRPMPRTLFVVGDEKQSIYSFQGADPAAFHRMRAFFEQRVTQAGQPWHEISLEVSFRSTTPVLGVVDSVFHHDNPARQGVLRAGQSATRHQSHRRGMAGRVEFWPLVQQDKAAPPPPWTIGGLTGGVIASAVAQMADNIAWHLEDMIGRQRLAARDRLVQPGDCLILVRQRNLLVEHLIRALKKNNIPVAGIDRMRVAGQLPVQDLLVLAQFTLLPDDDLTFASLLKSPFIGLDDAALMALAAQRGGSLWQRFSRLADHFPDGLVPDGLIPDGMAIRDWLDSWLNRADFTPPYEFFAQILHSPCPAHPQSGRAALMARLGRDILDPLDEFLQLAMDFQAANLPALEQFVAAMADNQHEIKRETDQGAGVVRIMTVHAAKGLQAPIVILPDTVLAKPLKVPGLLWPDEEDDGAFLWTPNKRIDVDALAQRREKAAQAAAEEYHRLLYVALTRAEDRLIIAGYGGKDEDSKSWYAHIRAGLGKLATKENHDIVFVEGDQHAEPVADRQHRDLVLPEPLGAGDIWLTLPPPDRVEKPGRLTPSRLEAEPALFSPFAPIQGGDPFRRGLLIHRLLQNLPDMPPPRRAAAASAFLAQAAGDWSDAVRAAMIAETLNILDHPVFAPVFGPHSRAEVPLTGIIDGQIVEAQLDRLVILPDRVLVVDYKTNRPPPMTIAGVPVIYRRQMALYAAALRRLYPGRRVETALLWTAIPLLMDLPVDDDLSNAS